MSVNRWASSRTPLLGFLSLIALLYQGGAFAQTTTYEYDALGRLVKVVRVGATTVTYAYDAADNRITVVAVPSPSPPPPPPPPPGPPMEWLYPLLF